MRAGTGFIPEKEGRGKLFPRPCGFFVSFGPACPAVQPLILAQYALYWSFVMGAR